MASEPNPNPDFSRAQREIAGRADEAGRLASEIFGSAKEDISQKAKEVAAEGKDALLDEAQLAQNTLTGAVAALGGAVRAASDHLANSDQKAAAKFALEAAGSLERMSASLKDKPFEEVLAEVRAFGGSNPAALFGGAMVAGLALGRFIKSSSPGPHAKDRPQPDVAAGSDTP
ncbi:MULTISPECIES: hypothetical protein [unclassified Mesorhizobium]|uniref:hypothetical protein n=1 Tax=unclassified Mesorhizobium TaxID=325217 RepID=UPI00109390F4|nr:MULTISPECIES: hypothetical protein [unclassified Mesorhizobium]TGU40200.1 hypothetical protein EN799_07225 [bacterium M00.F.Ca.ET.156.01.1.1]TGQ77123.1 hypothetical protein EN850_29585 [Mesorhizobium sp. M8A.F.Ca.ET.207.01.1.1]TGQ89217.1 hypothetical protein EN851_23410 [Mesorhizobium sp. M8A.F.Ca.ET.208.01.1.1]TGR32321.1 hypothetical protein EN845_07225 [Mesorhizobium sp. M8A.F.Ca.ET.202.01.1.1]TGS38096.1 hypothetical protein EN825_30115 [Mesorhizobium sp. M8A.F.Ca.ET.182.01.1.1]